MSRTNLTAARLAALEHALTPRDRAVIATLSKVRVATATQLERLHFGDVTRRRSRALLASLVGRRLLGRLPRVVGGARAGSAGYVYVLDISGQRLLSAPHGRPQRPWTVGAGFLAHSLAVTELYVRLAETERTGGLRLLAFDGEPACWCSFHGPGGVRAVLKPDAAVSVQVDGFTDAWFVEVDRGTESTTTLATKCRVYRHYWQSGTEQARHGVFPRVLWLVPDARRYDVLVEVLGRQPADSWPLHAVALYEDAIGRIQQGAAS